MRKFNAENERIKRRYVNYLREAKGQDEKLVLSRFSSGLFRAMFAMKEIWNGNEIHRRVSA